eukprot:TRINITY_DN2115_c1_g1_i1.p1 TRINITY_DN2115_c1_g1~~TRINITY_DN2115_c1_g1_i1.p1  ORF type:complete len:628 (+),score=192.78 TRINITY_DN2115_c1_g1_i1:426-2309(+)
MCYLNSLKFDNLAFEVETLIMRYNKTLNDIEISLEKLSSTIVHHNLQHHHLHHDDNFLLPEENSDYENDGSGSKTKKIGGDGGGDGGEGDGDSGGGGNNEIGTDHKEDAESKVTDYNGKSGIIIKEEGPNRGVGGVGGVGVGGVGGATTNTNNNTISNTTSATTTNGTTVGPPPPPPPTTTTTNNTTTKKRRTLLDWVPLEEVERMKIEAYNEVTEMKKLYNHLKNIGKKMIRKSQLLLTTTTSPSPSSLLSTSTTVASTSTASVSAAAASAAVSSSLSSSQVLSTSSLHNKLPQQPKDEVASTSTVTPNNNKNNNNNNNNNNNFSNTSLHQNSSTFGSVSSQNNDLVNTTAPLSTSSTPSVLISSLSPSVPITSSSSPSSPSLSPSLPLHPLSTPPQFLNTSLYNDALNEKILIEKGVSSLKYQLASLRKLNLNNNNNMNNEDHTVLQRTTESMKSQLTMLAHSLSVITSISDDVDNNNYLQTVFLSQANFSTEMLGMLGKYSIKRNKSYLSLEKLFREHKAGYKNLFEQLDELSYFYNQFHLSYIRLLLEIERRLKYFESEQQIVDQFQLKLNTYYCEELQKRTLFEKDWLIYLPQGFCPSIEEQLEQRLINPSKVTTSLPHVTN